MSQPDQETDWIWILKTWKQKQKQNWFKKIQKYNSSVMILQ